MAKRPATQMSACLLERVSTLDMLLSYSRYDLGCGVRRLHSGVATSPEDLQQCETIDARSLT